MTFGQPGSSILGSLSAGGVLRVCPDGKTPMADHRTGQTVGVAVDGFRREIHVTNWSEYLMALDADTLKPIRSVQIPALPSG